MTNGAGEGDGWRPPGESVPAFPVTPSQVEMETVIPPPPPPPASDASEHMREDTVAIPVSPGRQVGGEEDVARWTDRPVTLEEVAAPEWRRPPPPPPPPSATTSPSPASVVNGTRTVQWDEATKLAMAREVAGLVGETMAKVVAELRSALEQRATAESVTAILRAVGGVNGRVDNVGRLVAVLADADGRLERRFVALERRFTEREGHLRDVDARLKEMGDVIAGFRARIEEFGATVDGLRESIRETRSVADSAAQNVAALQESQRGLEETTRQQEAEIADARAAAQAVGTRLDGLIERVGDIERVRAQLATLDGDIAALERWRKSFNERIAKVTGA